MNRTDIDFDLITPDVITRPEKCPICDADPEAYFGRLNFRQPSEDFPIQYCPMHAKELKEGTVAFRNTRLIPC